MEIKKRYIFAAAALLALLYSCGTQKKVNYLNTQSMSAKLTLTKEETDIPELQFGLRKRDTLTVQDFDGREVLIMKAIKDDETGEMVATDVINAAVVTARFRNVAERNGKVDLAFKVTVPKEMMDSKWQARFYPDLFVMGDSLRLDPVIVTGTGYRKAQLKGYQQYEKFLSTIISDTTKFINMGQLELFLQRNIPQIYAFKSDSTEVSDEQFYSYYGVSEQQAIDHYTNKFIKNRNERRKARIGKMYNKYVKAPFITESIRLDTIIVDMNGDFEYNYVQTINTRPKLRKADITLSGAIFEQGKQIYTVPQSEPLTFYISSLSSFTDNRERYLTKVIERRAEANTESKIDFELGKAVVDESIGQNYFEIRNIKMTLASLLENEVFDLDSIVIRATASPEGRYAANKTLAQKRSQSVSDYFEKYLKHYADSLKRETGVIYDLDADYKSKQVSASSIRFYPRCIAENWDDLESFVTLDQELTDEQKEGFFRHCEIKDLDVRESALQKEPYYARLKDLYYPRLRTVKFNFYLHRKGLVKDTVHTTVLDSVYMKGVQALQDMEYAEALSYLRSYQDFNTAVAYTALDLNESAMAILSGLEKTDQVNYMLAILYSRKGEIEKAVQCYVTSCKQNHLLVHRGNLDPEISALINAYQLNRITEEQDDFEY